MLPALAIGLLSLVAACGQEATSPDLSPPLEKAASQALVTQVFTSGANTDTWNAIVPAQNPLWGTQVCVAEPAVGLNANWVNPHKAFVANGAAFRYEMVIRGFTSDWINSWPGYEWYNLSAQYGGPPGSLQQSWTRYSTPISGTGDFVLKLAADNCSWIYITNADGSNPVRVGVQLGAPWQVTSTYPVRLTGNHRLEFLVFDGGGQSGGMFRLETNSGQVVFVDTDGDGLADVSEINVHLTNPNNPDTDGDGLSDGAEVNTHNTNPRNPDSDGDGVSDGAEIAAGTDPNVKLSDVSAPVITANVSGTLGNNSWYTSNVNVTWTVTDAESSISSQSGCTASSVTTDTNGVTFTCSATSTGGSASQSVTVKRDATKPTVSGAPAGTLGSNGWYVSDVTVSWTAADAMSGIVSGCPSATRSTDTNGTTYDCTVTDLAGNSASASVSVKRDATAPTAVASVVGTLGNNSWYVSDVTVSFATGDGLSGVASTTGCATTVQSTDTGAFSRTCSVTDNAGNTASATASGKRDATKPMIGFTPSSASYTVDQTVSIVCSASDALSLLASNTCANVTGAAYTFNLGPNSRSASAVDFAGNTNTASTSFTVSVTNGSLCNLVRRFVTNAGVANSMCTKLEKSNYRPFQNEVEAQSGKQHLSAEHGAILLRLVDALD